MAGEACATCNKTASEVPNMKRCAKCQSTPYCSRECQKADWKSHKKICSQNGANKIPGLPNPIEHSTNYKSPRVKNLDKQIPDPFTRLDKGTFLHDRSEKDVYKLLIDAFRMRQADGFKFEGRKDPNSVYSGAVSSISGFRDFLNLVTRRKLLPPWWTDEKRKECEALGESNDKYYSLKKKIDKDAMIAHYGEQRMPMQLRMFAEEAYGSPPPGSAQGGKGMRSVMMAMEGNAGNEGGGFMSMMGL